MWFIIKGEVDIYRRPESLYDSKGKPTDSSKISLWSNPSDSGNLKIGVRVGTIKEYNFIAEDALFFN